MKAYRMRMDGKVDEAKLALEQELSKNPRNAAAWCELARLEFQRNGKTHELDSAQKAIEQAVNLAPDNARYHRWAGRIAVYNGILKVHRKNRPEMVKQFKKATSAAEQAVTLDPDDHEARMLLVSLYGNNPPELGGDQGRATHHVETLERRSPIDGAVARCEFSMKNEPEKKLALWNDLAKKFGKDPRVHENLARQHAWGGNVKNATIHTNNVLTLDPTRSHILLDLARAFGLKKQLEPAERFARRYLALDPPGPVSHRAWTHMALGQIQQMNGNNEASAESLEMAKRLDPYCWFTMTPPPEQLFIAPEFD
ncbi:MAG: hypothetical protein GY903_08410 [Fuerstiella sp.]|nr:hypothetical protein [Fuerstiella sp.]MCP4854501.1 hypothetical protein [Fuerstiella sp.]